jgi:hypothetical protein
MPCMAVTMGYCTCTSFLGCESVTCDTGYDNIGTLEAPNCVEVNGYLPAGDTNGC